MSEAEYRIIDEKGSGGEGVVYLATTSDLGLKVALKELDESEATLDEARKLAQAGKHENVVEVQRITHLVEGHKGTPYIVMDYVEGETLTHYLKATGPLPPSEWWTLLAPILKGVSHIHDSADLIHRDLKPDNIVLEYRNGIRNPVIVDFGLATRQREVPTDWGGTEIYAPPEWNSKVAIGRWSDVYSMAVISFGAIHGLDDLESNVWERAQMQDILKEFGTSFTSAIATGLELNPIDRPRSIWDWMVAMARPTAADPDRLPGVESFASDVSSRSTVGRLAREMERHYGLPSDCVRLCHRGGVVADGDIRSKELVEEYNSKDYDQRITLTTLGNLIGKRYGLGDGCVQFHLPRGEGLYYGQTQVATMLREYG